MCMCGFHMLGAPFDRRDKPPLGTLNLAWSIASTQIDNTDSSASTFESWALAVFDILHMRSSTTLSRNISLRCALYISLIFLWSAGVSALERMTLKRMHSLHRLC